MKHEGEEDNVEALPCGHTFHNTCLGRSIDISGNRKAESSPCRCHLRISNTFVDDADNSEPQAVEPEPTAQPNQDSDEEDQGRGIVID